MSASAAPTCLRCAAPRVAGPECPRCGVLYARAEARAAREAARAQTPTLLPEPVHAEALGERRLRVLALPAALLVAWAAVSAELPHFLLRTFLSMWVHETGHAVTAWLCGFPAFPGPWFTPVGEARAPLLSLLLAGGLAWLAWRGRRTRRPLLTAAAAGLLLVQLVCTLGLSPSRAGALVTFGGDAGCLVLGTVLMATALLPPDHPLCARRLHWGLLGIGAAAFADAGETWWAARRDADRIPFGMNEGVGLSDASRLVEEHGWSVGQLVSRHVWLGGACLLVLAVLCAWVLHRAGSGGSARTLPPARGPR